MTRAARRIIWGAGMLALAAVAATFVVGAPVLPATRSAVPTAKVVRGPLKLTVYATGELRAGRTVNLMAPPAGGMLRIVKLLQTGTAVKKDDDVLEFDAADQQYAVEQARTDLAEAEQQIVKMLADQAVQASQQKLDMLTARYNVRRSELDSAGNEFIGAIDAQKNKLTLEESRR
jgi:multidrug efflux pump subunit AcrA (membrane-fusion protein)